MSSSGHESQVLSVEAANLDPYQKLEKLKRMQAFQVKQQQQVQDKQNKDMPQPVKKGHQPGLAEKRPQPTLKPLFRWAKDGKDEYFIKAQEKSKRPVDFKVAKPGDKILNFLGYKIDMTGRAQEFMEKYQKFYVDARSHNFLLAKFSQLKFGMMQMVLTFLGVTTEELQKLQKKALKTAVEENVALFEQNEYNFELLTIFQHTRQDKGRLKVFNEMRKQLMEQMAVLGQKEYYTKERILLLKQEAVRKIMYDLLREKQNLEYVRDFQS